MEKVFELIPTWFCNSKTQFLANFIRLQYATERGENIVQKDKMKQGRQFGNRSRAMDVLGFDNMSYEVKGQNQELRSCTFEQRTRHS